MTFEIAVVLLLLIGAMLLFALEWLALDLIALMLLVSLVLLGVLTPEQAFSGFASEVIIILTSMFVISGALVQTGIMEWLGVVIHRAAIKSEHRLIGYLMAIAAATSALFSNTTATALLMPAAIKASNEAQMSPSQTLMPLAFGSVLGGTCTLIGTSTNMASSGLITKLGLAPYSLFEFSVVGLGLAVVGILYMSLGGYRLVPLRRAPPLADQYGIQKFLSELIIASDSALAGKSLGDLKLRQAGVAPLAIVRDGKKLSATPQRILSAGDKIVVKASRDALLQAKANHVFEIEAERTLSDKDLSPEDIVIAEAVLMPLSHFIGKTLRQLDFYHRFGLVVLAIYRRGHSYPTQIEHMALKVGDVLLLQGSTDSIGNLSGNQDLWGLAAIERKFLSRRKGAICLSSLTAAILASAFGLVPMSVAFLLAAMSLVLVRAISMEDAYSYVEWRLIILIAAMTSFGVAMQNTGAAVFLAEFIVEATLPYGAYATAAIFVLLTVALTQPMSNAAAALVILPVAVAASAALSINPRTLAILVTLSASLSFVTPLEPASLLVYGPGKYRFVDFIRAGLPLTLLTSTVLVFLVPMLWPF